MNRSRRSGFTLLEIMFSLVAGLIAVSVVYSLNNGTTRFLAEQNRLSTTQTSLRLAMEQLRADIERAGFLGSPNSDGETKCAEIAGLSVRAVEFTSGTFTGNVPNAEAHLVRADRLRLSGNYLTSGSYLVGTLADAAGNTIALQTSWQSFRRDFTRMNGANVEIDSDALNRVFAPSGTSRLLHIETSDRHHAYTRVTSVATNGLETTLSISPALTPGGICVGGLAGGAVVSPLNRIEYAILNPSNDTELAALVRLRGAETPAERAAIEGIPSVLVRYELGSDGVRLPNTTRVVLEFAVEFALSFDLDSQSGPDSVPRIVTNQPDYGTRPQQIRAVRVRLSARTPDAQPDLPFVARTNGGPLVRYYARDTNVASATGRPSARVRTLSTVVFVPNVAYADMP